MAFDFFGDFFLGDFGFLGALAFGFFAAVPADGLDGPASVTAFLAEAFFGDAFLAFFGLAFFFGEAFGLVTRPIKY